MLRPLGSEPLHHARLRPVPDHVLERPSRQPVQSGNRRRQVQMRSAAGVLNLVRVASARRTMEDWMRVVSCELTNIETDNNSFPHSSLGPGRCVQFGALLLSRRSDGGVVSCACRSRSRSRSSSGDSSSSAFHYLDYASRCTIWRSCSTIARACHRQGLLLLLEFLSFFHQY